MGRGGALAAARGAGSTVDSVKHLVYATTGNSYSDPPSDGANAFVAFRLEAGYLSGGEQQMLAIGRGLMTEPRLLMLDEPSLGLAPMLVHEPFDIIVRINAEAGVSILLVEQNAAVALEVSHHAYLIEQGRVVMSGAAAELARNPDVQEFYLGAGAGVDYQAVKQYPRRKRWLT